MSAGPALYLVVALLTAAATALLCRWAQRVGALDGPGSPGYEPSSAERKLQERPVPAIGGLAIGIGIAAGLLLVADDRQWLRLWCHPWAFGSSATLALLLGAWDDRRPLRAGSKFVGQLFAGLPLAVDAYFVLGEDAAHLGAHAALTALSATSIALAVWASFALVVNVTNTFDNSDGALATVAILGLALTWPLAACAIAGFLPFNVLRPEPNSAEAGRPPRRAAPFAYLGDGGSHLIGVLIFCVPFAWPLLALPLFDLVRVVRVRLRAGAKPWIGDRRHLAHGFEDRGAGTGKTLLYLGGVCAPPFLVAYFAQNASHELPPGFLSQMEQVASGSLLALGPALALFLWAVAKARPGARSQ